jgi:hypothetical protein
MTIAGLVFVLIVQLPNLLTQPWRGRQRIAQSTEMQKEIEKLDQSLARREIDKDEYRREVKAVRDKYRTGGSRDLKLEDLRSTATTINLAVPIGWLAYGAMSSAEGRVLPSVFGTVGLMLIAGVSLRRSYATTLRLYRGDFGNSRRIGNTSRSTGVVTATGPALFLERRLPWITDQSSAITVASFRSLTRAPEARILFLSPVVMVIIFGSMVYRGNANPPELIRPLMATGGIGLILLILSQLAGNQFGFDRNGFRTYVLSPVARRDVLIGKNLALAPIALFLTMMVVVIFEIAYPMRIDHFVAALIQTIPMYLVYCILENLLSMLAPMPVAPGSLKPSKPKGIQVLIHVAFFVAFSSRAIAHVDPSGCRVSFELVRLVLVVSVYLLFVILESVAAVVLYVLAMDWQGEILQRRERQILEVVTSKIE